MFSVRLRAGRMRKIFIRDAQTRLFKDGNGGWTSRSADALHFATIEAAGEEALRHTEHEMEVVLAYEACELALNPVYCARQ